MSDLLLAHAGGVAVKRGLNDGLIQIHKLIQIQHHAAELGERGVGGFVGGKVAAGGRGFAELAGGFLGEEARVFYRHRPKNTNRKAGNIADFVSRWGGHYEHMVVLDADMEKTPKDQVANVRPVTTICDGRVTFEA